MLNHVITGGSGFIGRHLANTLTNMGHSVVVLDLFEPIEKNPKVNYVCGSIMDKKFLNQVLKNADTVHHLAAAVPLARSKKLFYEINFQGTINVFDAALQAGCTHFNFLSSCAVFGKPMTIDCPLSENSKKNPFEHYGKSKFKAELFLEKKMAQQDKMTISILRPRTVIGAERLGIFEILFNWVKYNKDVRLIGDGQNIFQLLHVQDLISACIQASKKKLNGSYNLGASRYSSMHAAISNLIEERKSDSKIKYISPVIAKYILKFLYFLRLSPLGPWHYTTSHIDYYFDTSKAKSDLAWEPIYSNDEMLKEAYDYFLNSKITNDKNLSMHNRLINRGILALLMKN